MPASPLRHWGFEMRHKRRRVRRENAYSCTCQRTWSQCARLPLNVLLALGPPSPPSPSCALFPTLRAQGGLCPRPPSSTTPITTTDCWYASRIDRGAHVIKHAASKGWRRRNRGCWMLLRTAQSSIARGGGGHPMAAGGERRQPASATQAAPLRRGWQARCFRREWYTTA
jgi:hypothetical protein